MIIYKVLKTKQNLEWFSIKLCVSIFFFWIIDYMLKQSHEMIAPVGICKIYSFDILFTSAGKTLMIGILILAILFYLLEQKMVWATLVLSIISIIVITYHESNGIFIRATVMSGIWIAQFIAYLRFYYAEKFNLEKYRIQYPIQIIAAIYTLAGISKIEASGVFWFWNSELFSLQIFKNFFCSYADIGNPLLLQKANDFVAFFQNYSIIGKFLLGVSLLLELFCLIALRNKKLMILWGFGLLSMHIGIAFFMDIGFSVVAFPMIIFFLNPLYYILFIGKKIAR